VFRWIALPNPLAGASPCVVFRAGARREAGGPLAAHYAAPTVTASIQPAGGGGRPAAPSPRLPIRCRGQAAARPLPASVGSLDTVGVAFS